MPAAQSYHGLWNAGGVNERPCYLASLLKWETEAAGLSAPRLCRLPAPPGAWRAASQWEHRVAWDGWGRQGQRETLPERAHCLSSFPVGGLVLKLALQAQGCTRMASAWPRTVGLSRATVDAPGLLKPLAVKPRSSLLPTALRAPPAASSPRRPFLPLPVTAGGRPGTGGGEGTLPAHGGWTRGPPQALAPSSISLGMRCAGTCQVQHSAETNTALSREAPPRQGQRAVHRANRAGLGVGRQALGQLDGGGHRRAAGREGPHT